MSGFDFGQVADIFTSGVGKVVDVASKVAEAKFSWQQRNLDMQLKNAQILQQKSQIQLGTFIAKNNAEIQKVQAQAQLQQAQDAAKYGYFDLMQANMSTGIGNVSSAINRQGAGGSIMLWLTVAGVGIAVLQYVKGK